jgi:folate-dependent phosphoribosylglycinamide formyltransferase PurN
MGWKGGDAVFDRAVIIGSGKLACQCAETAIGAVKELEVIESECPTISFLKGVCKKHDLRYRQITDKNILSNWFMGTADSTLVISAFNTYIFPRPVVEHKKLRIVNFHNALLPRHRGRNACTWAIFEMDAETGITWHQVGAGIDDGDIIVQKKLKIEPLTTALELTDRCLQLGAVAFRDILLSLVRGDCQSRPQSGLTDLGVVHRGMDVPNNGLLEICWPIEKISAFLRSVDYGKYKIFGNSRVSVSGVLRTIAGYRITVSDYRVGPAGERVVLRGHRLTIQENQKTIEVSLHA